MRRPQRGRRQTRGLRWAAMPSTVLPSCRSQPGSAGSQAPPGVWVAPQGAARSPSANMGDTSARPQGGIRLQEAPCASGGPGGSGRAPSWQPHPAHVHARAAGTTEPAATRQVGSPAAACPPRSQRPHGRWAGAGAAPQQSGSCKWDPYPAPGRASCSRLPAAIREATLAPGAAAKAGAHGATPALGTGLQATPAAGPGTSSIGALAGPTATATAPHRPVPLAVTFAQLQPGWALWGHSALAASRWLLVAPVPAGRGAGAGNGLERGQRDRLYRGAESQAGTNRRRGRQEGPLLSLVRRQRWQGAAVPRSYLGRGGALFPGPSANGQPGRCCSAFPESLAARGAQAGSISSVAQGSQQSWGRGTAGGTLLPPPWLDPGLPPSRKKPLTPQEHQAEQAAEGTHPSHGAGRACGGPAAWGGPCLVQQLADAPAAEQEADTVAEQPQQPGAQARSQRGAGRGRQCHRPGHSPGSARRTGHGAEEAHGRPGTGGV